MPVVKIFIIILCSLLYFAESNISHSLPFDLSQVPNGLGLKLTMLVFTLRV